MQRIKDVLKRIPGLHLLQPGWPDQARVLIQAPIFKRLLADHPPRGSCLNAGSGEGLFLEFLNGFGDLRRIVHMDLKRPDLSRWESDPRNEAVPGSLTNLPFGEAEFDFVFCTEVLEHVEGDAKALREIARVLKPGGTVLLSTPTPPAPDDPAHVREGYTLDELKKKLASAGFEIANHEYCFHAAMRALLKTWRWQYEMWGKRSRMPKAAVLAYACSDRLMPIGKPWDLVVLARKAR